VRSLTLGGNLFRLKNKNSHGKVEKVRGTCGYLPETSNPFDKGITDRKSATE
jgi:hypothetical protein